MVASHDNTFNPLSHYGHYTTTHISHYTCSILTTTCPTHTTTNFILFSTLPIPHDPGLFEDLGIWPSHIMRSINCPFLLKNLLLKVTIRKLLLQVGKILPRGIVSRQLFLVHQTFCNKLGTSTYPAVIQNSLEFDSHITIINDGWLFWLRAFKITNF